MVMDARVRDLMPNFQIESIFMDMEGDCKIYISIWDDDGDLFQCRVLLGDFNHARKQLVYDTPHTRCPGAGVIVGTYGSEIYYWIKTWRSFNAKFVKVVWAGIVGTQATQCIPHANVPPEWLAHVGQVGDPTNVEAFSDSKYDDDTSYVYESDDSSSWF